MDQNRDRIHFESEAFAVLWNSLDDNQRLGLYSAGAWYIFELRMDASHRRRVSWTFVDTHDSRKDNYGCDFNIFASDFVPKG